MYKYKDRIVFKHEPILINGVSVLKDNKWNFMLSHDNTTMVNTQVKDFVLHYDENSEKEFAPLFSLNTYKKVPYSTALMESDSIPRGEIFREGADVVVDNMPTLMEFIWVPIEYLDKKDVILHKKLIDAYNIYTEKLEEADSSRARYYDLLSDYTELTGKNSNDVDVEIRKACRNHNKEK